MSGDSSYSDSNHSPNFVNLDRDLNSVRQRVFSILRAKIIKYSNGVFLSQKSLSLVLNKKKNVLIF